MTYAELAEIRGITKQSALKLSKRNKWQRMRGNDGAARILVPLDRSPPKKKRVPRTHPLDKLPPVSAVEAAIAALTEQLDRERARADQAEARADQATARADREADDRRAAEAALAAERAADAARRARSLLARLAAAVRGE